MSYETLEILWLVSALFFAFPQAIGAVVLSSFPQDLDKAIEYFESLLRPLNLLLGVSFISLFFAIGISWYYFVPSGTSIIYIILLAITLIGIVVFFLSNLLFYRFVQNRLRPEFQNTSD